jgi:hypothetical protein
MASGAKHYITAEELLVASTAAADDGELTRQLLLEAQVHATLAGGAGPALAHSPEHMTIADGTAWFNAASVKEDLTQWAEQGGAAEVSCSAKFDGVAHVAHFWQDDSGQVWCSGFGPFAS